MSAAIEIQIQKLLHQFGDPLPVAQSLANRAQIGDFNDQETIEICHFCHRAGCYETLSQLLLYLIESNKELPWALMAELLWTNDLLVTEDWSSALQEGARASNQLDELSQSKIMRENFDHLKDVHKERVNRRFAEHAHRKTHLLDQIDIARAQQMIGEEKKHIDQLIKLFPNERIGQDQKQKLQERWAREILSRHSSASSRKWQPEDESKDYRDILDLIFSQAAEELESSPELAQDFASMFVMFEDYEHALLILQSQESNADTAWLQVEMLLLLHRYAEAINLVGDLEHHYAKDPEVAFTSAYLKAQALWGLKKKNQAIEIMESIASARPTYRSAQSYLSLWRNPER